MSNFIYVLTQPDLLAWLLKATALLVLALGATTLLRRASAGTRHLVWLATLAGILLLPAVSMWTPIRLAIVPARLMPSLPQLSAPPTAPPAAATPSSPAIDVAPPTATPVVSTQARPAPSAPLAPALPNEPAFPIWTTILLLWGAAAVVLFVWLAFGALSVRRIVKSGRVLDERAWTAPLCEIADRLDLDSVPRLLSSPLIEMPFACGVVEPTIVLPASAEQWSDSRRRAVLFHELAHVKRRDLVGHTLGRVACALYWFHPLVWTAARRLRAESERACDDLVLSCGARASDYADHLLDIVISVRHQGAPATAMPMARRRELEGRVLAILDPAVARIGPGRVKSAAMLVGFGTLALSVAAMAPAAQSAERDWQSDARGAQSAERGAVGAPHSATRGAPNVAIRHNESSAVARVVAPSARPAPSPTLTPSPAVTPNPASQSLTLSDALGKISVVAVREAAQALNNFAQSENSKNKRQPNQGVDSGKVALLLKVLRSDPDADVRRMAAWGLSDAGDTPTTVEALAEAVRSDEDDGVREMAAWALADSRREIARRALLAALRRDASDKVRETAVWALGNAGLRDDREAVEEALTSDPSDEVRESAAWALGNSARRPASRALVAALGDKSADVRESAAWALAETQDDDVAPAVTAAFMREQVGEVRMAELRALTFMHVDDKAVLDAALASKDAELRSRAVRMLAGSSGAWPEPRPRPRPRPMP
ncbi:MAG TPA: M56 family metallopeptidase [Gemmatimonadaceae bacterium]|nr:M56 family metallopeptidase [Gemmatimonadaceae bacterium]